MPFVCFLSEWNKKERDLFLSKMEKVVAPLCCHKRELPLCPRIPLKIWMAFTDRERRLVDSLRTLLDDGRDSFPGQPGPGSDVAFDPNPFETVRPGPFNTTTTHSYLNLN